MLKSILNKLLMVFYFIIGALLLEAVTFNILNFGTMPEYFWLNFVIIAFIAVLVYIIPNFTAQYVIYTIILFVQTVFIYINYSLYMVYGDLFSMEMINFVGEAAMAMTSSFIYVSVLLKLIAVFLIIAIIGYLFLTICRKSKIQLKQHFSVFSVIIMLSLQCFSSAYFFSTRNAILNISSIEQDNYVESDTFLMESNLLKNKSYAKFGTYGYFLNMVVNRLSGLHGKMKQATIDYFKNGQTYSSSDVFGVDEGNNVIVIMMESLEWFGFGDGSYSPKVDNLSPEITPNVYSIIYGDDYLDDVANENLANDALISTNYFSKAKTNMSEGIGILGNYPIGTDLSDIAYRHYINGANLFGYSLPNMLKQGGLNYTTSYVHSNVITFYNRNLTHHNIGFDVVVGKDTIRKDADPNGELLYSGDDLKWDHWENEGVYAKNALNYIVPQNYQQKPFYTFYLNVSSHGSYQDENNLYDKDVLKYRDYIKFGEENCTVDDLGYYHFDKTLLTRNKTEQDFYSNWYKTIIKSYAPDVLDELLNYECGVKGLDDAIGEIVNKLKTSYYSDGSSVYDKTTMVFYSDHYTYYDSLSNRVKGFPTEDFSSVELNTVPMIISSPGLKKQNATNNYKYLVNQEFCSAYDIVPTVLDLLGISFNKNVYVGSSIFDDSVPKFTLNNKQYKMTIYYSITGGIFSHSLYTYDFNTFVALDPRVGQDTLNLFKQEAYKTLVKINYLNILNNYQLYNQID